MKLTVSSKPIDNLQHEGLFLGFFSDEKPPRGYTGVVDWRMNGSISRQMAKGKITGAFAEKVLISPNGRIPSPKIMLLGLGSCSKLTYEKLYEAGRIISSILQGIGCKDPAFDVPGIGRCRLEISKMAKSLALGFFDSLVETSKGGESLIPIEVIGQTEYLDEIILGMHEFKVEAKNRAVIEIIDLRG